MGLKDIGATLPPGFRFNPSDEELICHYLHKKIFNEEVLKGTLMEIDLHTCEPWQLPDMAKLNTCEWYFFSFRDRKYATGYRTNRATPCGYWKATGKDRTVYDPVTSEVVGMRKTLVFYLNRAPNGIKTDWIMHEFRLERPLTAPKEDWVLCRVFYKSKQGENTSSATNPISTPNKFQINLKHNVTSPPPIRNPNNNNNINIPMPLPPQNNNTFHKHSLIMPCEYQQPHITMPIYPDPPVFHHHHPLEPNHVPIPISVAAVHDHICDSHDYIDDDCLRFLRELKEDNNNIAMDNNIVSTLGGQLGFGLDDSSTMLFP